MQMKLIAIFFTILLIISESSFAKSSGAYVSGAAGVNFMNDSDLDGPGVNTDIDFDEGFAGAVALGYRADNGIRGEVEANYLKNDVDGIVGAVSTAGSVNSLSFMLNILYDIETGSRFTPYFGAGAGFAIVDYDHVNPVNGVRISESDEIPVAQGIIGLSYSIDDNLEFFGNYKYLSDIGDSPEITAANANLEGDHENNIIMLGLRYSFGGEAKKPAPQISQAPKREVVKKEVATEQEPEKKYFPKVVKKEEPKPKKRISRFYLVFFDFDEYKITNDAKKILDKVLEDSARGFDTKVEVTGHADRVGSDKYNMKLSIKRAEAVRSYLEKNGIKGKEIDVFAKGETELAVPTEDGVAEPQNRRATIIYTIK